MTQDPTTAYATPPQWMRAKQLIAEGRVEAEFHPEPSMPDGQPLCRS